MSPHATNLLFLFPSALTSKTRQTLIHLYSVPGKMLIPKSWNVWYENIWSSSLQTPSCQNENPFSLSNKTGLAYVHGTQTPNLYLTWLLSFLHLMAFIMALTNRCHLAVQCTNFQPGLFNKPLSNAYLASVMGSCFAMTLRGSHVKVPLSQLTRTL